MLSALVVVCNFVVSVAAVAFLGAAKSNTTFADASLGLLVGVLVIALLFGLTVLLVKDLLLRRLIFSSVLAILSGYTLYSIAGLFGASDHDAVVIASVIVASAIPTVFGYVQARDARIRRKRL